MIALGNTGENTMTHHTTNMAFLLSITMLLGITMLLASSASAQWTNRYPKVEGFGHHVYLEGHEFPSLTSGPIDPAVSPDGKSLAYADKGFIWLLDLASSKATRLTKSAAIDSRPRWARDGGRLAFIRDNGTDTSIVVHALNDGTEAVINTPTIELDPEFSADGEYLYFTSGIGGTLNIWRQHLLTGNREQITDLNGVERNARMLKDGSGMVYVHLAGFSEKNLRYRSFTKGTDEPIYTTGISAHLMADTHPTEQTIVVSLPQVDDYRLFSMDVHQPDFLSELTPDSHYTLTPTWSADGDSIYFSEPDDNQQFRLMRTSAYGGGVEPVNIKSRDWGEERRTVTIKTIKGGAPTAARLSVTGADGHPAAPSSGPVYFDGQNGMHYFYTDGSIDLDIPPGAITVTATNGLMTKADRQTIDLGSANTAVIELSIGEVWDAAASGYASADYHFHINYDGPYQMVPTDVKPLLDGENLTVGAPLLANLHTRLMDRAFAGQQVVSDKGNILRMGQEVRSHFHGHLGLLGIASEYRPWHWGPRSVYPRLAGVDRSNGEVLAATSDAAGLVTYMHPVATNLDPFAEGNLGSIPLEFISDAILSKTLGLEIVCAWTDEMGTSELWYRLLNIGKPVVAMAGTDSFAAFHRTPAAGSARVYANMDGATPTWDNVLEKTKRGETFVTNAPVLLFTLDGDTKPGGVISAGTHTWSIDLTSALAVDNVEVVVNGEVVWQSNGIKDGYTKNYNGTVNLPEGGWVAARAHGGRMTWPGMDSYPFAHTSPIWIDHVGSTDAAAEAAAKADLLNALDNARNRAKGAYGDQQIDKFNSRIEAAIQALSAKK